MWLSVVPFRLREGERELERSATCRPDVEVLWDCVCESVGGRGRKEDGKTDMMFQPH